MGGFAAGPWMVIESDLVRIVRTHGILGNLKRRSRWEGLNIHTTVNTTGASCTQVWWGGETLLSGLVVPALVRV